MTAALPVWRPMTAADLPAVEAIAGAVHPGFFETPAVFAERLSLYPEGARLLSVDGAPAGYVLSHPWHLGSLPALNVLLGTLPADADSYYVHDLALLPAARGTGAAAAVIADLAALAADRGFAAMSLVAVNDSRRFWERQGFAPVEAPQLAAKLLSYEDAACYMVRRLAFPAGRG